MQALSSEKSEKFVELERLQTINQTNKTKITDLSQQVAILSMKCDDQELQIGQLQHIDELHKADLQVQTDRVRQLTSSEKLLKDKLEQSLKTEKEWANQVRSLQDQIEEFDMERGNRERVSQQEVKNWKSKFERSEEANKNLSAGILIYKIFINSLLILFVSLFLLLLM